MARKNYYRIAEKWCKDYGLAFVGIESILKGNRLDIVVGKDGCFDKDGKLITKKVIIGCGQQEVECERFIYTTIRNDNTDGTDGIALFNFKDIDDARSWIRQDIDRTLASLNIRTNRHELSVSKDYWVYEDIDNGVCIDWSIRRIPLQNDDTWTDPEYAVRYRINNGK